MIRATLECDTHDDLVKWATKFLASLGYDVDKRKALHAKETAPQFARRMGICPNSFSRTLHHPDCPTNYEIRKGAKGVQTIWIRASAELEDFFQTNKKRQNGK
jgi:hypothetical protein